MHRSDHTVKTKGDMSVSPRVKAAAVVTFADSKIRGSDVFVCACFSTKPKRQIQRFMVAKPPFLVLAR